MSDKNTQVKIRLITSEKNWIETEAIDHLKHTADLEGVVKAVGLPDIHPGNGHPVGAAFAIKDYIYPNIIGNDIGCGIALFQTDLKKAKMKRDKWVKKLSGLEDNFKGDVKQILMDEEITPTEYDDALGTIGGGNHFAELQSIEKVYNTEELSALGIDPKNLMLMVHSGTRSYGAAIFQEHVDLDNTFGLKAGTDEANRYFKEHNNAIKWAHTSRKLIAERFLEQIGSSSNLIVNVEHNCISKTYLQNEEYYIHRKGAARSDKGAVVIAGSRGTYSYLVKPIGLQEENLFSLAHGAGRKWKRNNSKAILGEKFTVEKMQQTELGSVVICEDKDLLYEEAPQAYKNIEHIISALIDAGIIEVIAQLKPIITYKVRK